jgi:predicted transcriptional regulator
MKSISLKLQDAIFKESEQLSDLLKTSRNKYINEALAFYNAFQKRKLLEEQLHRESELVAADSMEILGTLEAFEDEW